MIHNPIKVRKPFTIINSSANTYPSNKTVEYLSMKKHATGARIQIRGVALSSTFLFFANNENANKPIRGPYVNVATLKIAVTTEALFTALNNSITSKIMIENTTCT